MSQKSTKKVLFIITKSVWGGAQKYVYDLAANLPKDRFEPIVAGGGKGVMAEKIISADLPYFEIKSFQRDINLFKEIFSFFEILSLLLKTKPDIIHVSSSKAGGVAGVACLAYSLKNLAVKPPRDGLTAIFTVHGWAFLEDRPKWQIFLIKLASKLTCLFYDKIICVSQNDCNEALKNKIAPARKLIVINNGINPADYDFSSTSTSTPDFDVMESSSKSGVDVNEFWVGTIGENVKNKGHKYLREAAKKMAGVELNIISGVPNAAKFLKSFDIFVLPSVKEGLPYVILEAGLAKLPVIASNVGGVSEIITDGENGLLVPPKNPEALAEAIKKLINDKATREKLAQNLHQKILQDFSLQKMLSATVATYEK